MCAPMGAILMNTFGDKLLAKDSDAPPNTVSHEPHKHGMPSTN